MDPFHTRPTPTGNAIVVLKEPSSLKYDLISVGCNPTATSGEVLVARPRELKSRQAMKPKFPRSWPEQRLKPTFRGLGFAEYDRILVRIGAICQICSASEEKTQKDRPSSGAGTECRNFQSSDQESGSKQAKQALKEVTGILSGLRI
jgi:hypothetical protein